MSALSNYLRQLHRLAGMPSTRTVGTQAGVSHTTVAATLNGTQTPSWFVTQKIAKALLPTGESTDRVQRLWEHEKLDPEVAVSNEPTVWARVQWGGALTADEFEPSHVSSYQGIVDSAMRPRWYRAVLHGPGRSVATPWVEFDVEDVL